MIYVSKDGFFEFNLDVQPMSVTNASGQTFTMHDFVIVGYKVLKGPYEGGYYEGVPYGVDMTEYDREIQEFLDN